METYVVGEYKQANENKEPLLQQLKKKLELLGYQFQAQEAKGYFAFRKLGRIESVITELLPICERIGVDVEEFALREYRANDNSRSASYIDGKIVREAQKTVISCRQG